MEKPIFTNRQHLEAWINGVMAAYTHSPDPAHTCVAGAFQACLDRMDFLYSKIEKLETEKEQLVSVTELAQSALENIEHSSLAVLRPGVLIPATVSAQYCADTASDALNKLRGAQ